MFTGIITDVGHVLAIEPDGDPRYRIGTAYDTAGVALGASIAHSGVCLTVIATGPGWFDVQVSAETLGLTSVKHWRVGSRTNLERALKVGDELGGHIVSGHVDGIGRVVERRTEQESVRFTFEVPPALERLVARKGSIAIDGVSLTVNEVEGARFGVNVIPHTQQMTSFGTLAVGDEVNLEVDMLARYVARLLGKDQP
jgi:riboflavin synthase